MHRGIQAQVRMKMFSKHKRLIGVTLLRHILTIPSTRAESVLCNIYEGDITMRINGILHNPGRSY